MTFAEKLRAWIPLHENPVSCALHFLGGYLFVFALAVPLSFASLDVGGVALTPARVAFAALAIYMVSLEWTAGLLSAALLLPTLLAAEQLATLPHGTAAALALGVMVFRFSIVVGAHALFEKKFHGLSLGGPVLFVVEPVYLFTLAMFRLGAKQELQARVRAAP